MKRDVFSINGLVLSVASTGDGDPFLFQHGLCGAADQPAEIFPHNGKWKCITVESRGHGKSPCGDPAHLSIERYTKDLAEFIHSLNIGPIPVGGISMGAAIALRLAVKHPKLVRALVIARPAWIDKPSPNNLAANREVAKYLARYDPKEARALFEHSRMADQIRRDAPENLNSLLGFFERKPIAETRALLSTIASDGPGVSKREISRIDIPTMVIGTQKDVIHPLSMSESLAELIPSARLVEITPKSDSRHRHCQEFRIALSEFFKEID